MPDPIDITTVQGQLKFKDLFAWGYEVS